MRRIRASLVLALLAGAAGTAASGQQPALPRPSASEVGYLTAGELANRCSSLATTDAGYCFAYIAAVNDTLKAYEIWLDQREFCPATSLSQGDLRRTFLTYLAAYPSNRGGLAASVVTVALKETYPCVETGPAPPKPTPAVPSPHQRGGSKGR